MGWLVIAVYWLLTMSVAWAHGRLYGTREMIKRNREFRERNPW